MDGENERLARIETLLDGLEDTLRSLTAEMEKRNNDHEVRLRALEQQMARQEAWLKVALGVTAVIQALASGVAILVR